MQIVISLLGGLGLFLYGMNLMGESLEKVAGSKMKKIIELLTKNIFMGVLLGAVVTAVIQSSSATTVMVVGFVNGSSTSSWGNHGCQYRYNSNCANCIV